MEDVRDWFTYLGGPVMMMTPVATLTGAAREGLQGVSENPVEIIDNSNAYWIKVLLPCPNSNLVYWTYHLENGTRMRIVGAIRGGERMGQATVPVVLGRRAQNQQVYPLGQFTISFDLPEPVSLDITLHELMDNGILELFFLKAHVFRGAAPPEPPTGEATEPEPSPAEGAPPAPAPSS